MKVHEEKDCVNGSHQAVESVWEFIPLPFVAMVLMYCAMLYLLSSVSSFPAPPPFVLFDKIVHFFLFAGLSTVIAMGLHQARHRYSSMMQIFIPVSFSIIYGISDEIHQLLVPFRDFSMSDVAADTAGAATAAAGLFLVHQWKKLRK